MWSLERAGEGKTLFGMVHLLPLPGSPNATSLSEVVSRARSDAETLLSAGFAGLVIENFGDAPFYARQVPPTTVACMTAVATELRRVFPDAVLGINVLRNDASAALAVAAAAAADFIRVNVHCGVAYTDQGLVEGNAHETLRLRASLDARVLIAADVGVKHALFPPGFDLVQSARDTAYRGLADALIVTGCSTGAAADPAALEAVRKAVPDRALWIGSGLTENTAQALLARADGAIVGTAVKENGDVLAAVDAARAREFVAAARD